jgi:hypothetical protein
MLRKIARWRINRYPKGFITPTLLGAQDAGGHLSGLRHFTGVNRLASQSETVRAYTLDELVASFFASDLINMDIEGAKFEVLCSGAADHTLTALRTILFLELHGKDRSHRVAAKLHSHHDQLSTLDNQPCTFTRDAIYHCIAIPSPL